MTQINDGPLALGIVGALLVLIPQSIPQLGLAYRPLHDKPLPGMCHYGQLPVWAVALVYFAGTTMQWAGTLVAALHSNREHTDDARIVTGFMVAGLIGFILAHIGIHYKIFRHTKGMYNHSRVSWSTWRQSDAALIARTHMDRRATVGAMAVGMSLFPQLIFGTAIHAEHLPALTPFGYILWFLGWWFLLRVRIRSANNAAVEITAFAFAVICMWVGTGVIVWDMTTGDSE